jgi:hypothetical protein
MVGAKQKSKTKATTTFFIFFTIRELTVTVQDLHALEYI